MKILIAMLGYNCQLCTKVIYSMLKVMKCHSYHNTTGVFNGKKNPHNI